MNQFHRESKIYFSKLFRSAEGYTFAHKYTIPINQIKKYEDFVSNIAVRQVQVGMTNCQKK